MERRARGDGRGPPVARSAPASQTEERKGREEGEGCADRWGQLVSDTEEKGKGRRRWAARKRERWAGWVENVGEVLFCFCFFSVFKLFSNSNHFNSNSFQTFQTFSQNFINLLDLSQATKNHAQPNNDAQTHVVSKLIKLN
jgi:hypothetical protein